MPIFRDERAILRAKYETEREKVENELEHLLILTTDEYVACPFIKFADYGSAFFGICYYWKVALPCIKGESGRLFIDTKFPTEWSAHDFAASMNHGRELRKREP